MLGFVPWHGQWTSASPQNYASTARFFFLNSGHHEAASSYYSCFCSRWWCSKIPGKADRRTSKLQHCWPQLPSVLGVASGDEEGGLVLRQEMASVVLEHVLFRPKDGKSNLCGQNIAFQEGKTSNSWNQRWECDFGWRPLAWWCWLQSYWSDCSVHLLSTWLYIGPAGQIALLCNAKLFTTGFLVDVTGVH